MIDTHCPLTDTRLNSHLKFVITRATLACVTRLITIGTGLEDSQGLAASKPALALR